MMAKPKVLPGQGDLFEDVVREAEEAGATVAALVPTVARCEDCGKPLRDYNGRVSGLGLVCAAKRGRTAHLLEKREAPAG